MKVGPDSLERDDAASAVKSAAITLETLQSLKKDEFETTAEFRGRKQRNLEMVAGQLPNRFILPVAAESSYDADAGKLTVLWPTQLFVGGDVNVLPYGCRWPDDFVSKDDAPRIVLPLAREEARAVKPTLAWALVARLPLGEMANGDPEDRVVTISPRRVQVAMIPLAALLYSKADGQVLHEFRINLPANLRVMGPNATLQDWVAASDVVRAQVVARTFPGTKPDPLQLWLDVRGALERKQIAPTDPVVSLVRVAELPKPTAPIAVKQTRAKYPFAMRRAGISGEVIVRFRIKEDGMVADAAVERSSQREFEAAAIACVTEWRFKPATLGGKPIAVAMSVPILFSLNEE